MPSNMLSAGQGLFDFLTQPYEVDSASTLISQMKTLTLRGSITSPKVL